VAANENVIYNDRRGQLFAGPRHVRTRASSGGLCGGRLLSHGRTSATQGGCLCGEGGARVETEPCQLRYNFRVSDLICCFMTTCCTAETVYSSLDAMATAMVAVSLRTVLGIDTLSSSFSVVAAPSKAQALQHPVVVAAAPKSSTNAAAEAPLALDKKSLELTPLSLLQDDRFLDLVHSQYLKVVRPRAASINRSSSRRRRRHTILVITTTSIPTVVVAEVRQCSQAFGVSLASSLACW
jgi:hypothetical protein